MNWGHLIQERICSHWSKFFSLRVNPILGRLHPPGMHIEDHKLSPFESMAEMEVYRYTLNPPIFA